MVAGQRHELLCACGLPPYKLSWCVARLQPQNTLISEHEKMCRTCAQVHGGAALQDVIQAAGRAHEHMATALLKGSHICQRVPAGSAQRTGLRCVWMGGWAGVLQPANAHPQRPSSIGSTHVPPTRRRDRSHGTLAM